MNFNTLSGSAKLYKKLATYATGQTVPSGEVPNIAIICSVNGFEHKRLVESVGFGVRSKGGVVNIYNISSFGFFNKTNPMTAKYAESFRRSTASNAEAIIKTNLIDGVVLVTDCDITAAGVLEGAARAGCPALIVPVGIYNGPEDTEHLKISGKVAGGKLNSRESEELIKDAIVSKGISNNFNSISTFITLAEAMGFCIPDAALTQIDSSAHLRTAVATGEQICISAKDLLTPKKFLTRAALNNAAALCLAIGGDISALNWLISLIKIFDPKQPHEMIAEMTAKTPLLFAPEKQNCVELKKAGGINAILKTLSITPKLINDTALIYNGEKLKNVLEKYEAANLEPVSKTARIVFAKGSACEDGGYVQPTEQTAVSISGKAWVYQSLEEADKALLSGSIPSGSVIVVHNCIDTYVTSLAYAIEGMKKTTEIAVITDGLCEKTSALVVTKCTPNSLANEAFANIQNGDTIEIDLGKGRLNTSVLSKEQKTRQKKNSVKKQVIYFS